MAISIVIPVLNELNYLQVLLPWLKEKANDFNSLEILIVDASEDSDIEHFCKNNEVGCIKSEIKQRSHQMNLGAEHSKGDILYFLHVDSRPPKEFDNEIVLSLEKSLAGCFRLKFDINNHILSFYSYFSRFHGAIFHGGDASLFIKKSDFIYLGKFDESKDLMEDYNMIRRIKKTGNFNVNSNYVITSARKYDANGFIRLQWKFTMIHFMNFLGFKQEKLKAYYSKHIR